MEQMWVIFPSLSYSPIDAVIRYPTNISNQGKLGFFILVSGQKEKHLLNRSLYFFSVCRITENKGSLWS